MSRALIVSLSAAGLLAGGFIALGLWTYLSASPLGVPLSGFFPWPIACSTRGCVTSRTWHAQAERSARVAQATGQDEPREEKVLNTLIRQHLSHYAQLRSPVGIPEAQRYRREMLNIPDEMVAQSAGLSAYEYDLYFLVPFLEQERLRQARSAESADELYAMLAKERWVFALPRAISWNREEGRLE